MRLNPDGTFDYAGMTSAEIVADLYETVQDLVYYGGRDDLTLLVEALGATPDDLPGLPSPELVAAMNELLRYDANQLDPATAALMRRATNEIVRLGGPRK